MEKKTPLYDTHVKYGGKIVEFGGFLLPVQYPSGVKAEHMAVRTQAGLFDVSHMGEIWVRGEYDKIIAFLNHVLTNDFTGMKPGNAKYSPICNDNGGTVDDLIAYMKSEKEVLLVPNAANTEKDFAWFCDHKTDGVELENDSASWGQLALQGPKADEILHKVMKDEDIPKGYYTCVFGGDFKGFPVMVSRTGYTGEDGFEVYMPADHAVDVWETLLEAGKDEGLIPCGLGARDTLRLEAGMPLYGHEMNDEISPRTAGLGFAVKMDKPDFIGKAALEADKPLKRRRVGLKVTGRGIIREHLDVYKDGKLVGQTTSGTFLPYLGSSYGNAIVDAEARELGSTVQVDVRGRMVDCEMVSFAFYKRES